MVFEAQNDYALGDTTTANVELRLVIAESERVVVGQQFHRAGKSLPAAGVILDRARILQRYSGGVVDQRICIRDVHIGTLFGLTSPGHPKRICSGEQFKGCAAA